MKVSTRSVSLVLLGAVVGGSLTLTQHLTLTSEVVADTSTFFSATHIYVTPGMSFHLDCCNLPVTEQYALFKFFANW